jgi:nicotinate-nucleotide adenylyltransferase
MAALATLDECGVEVSTIELEAPDRPYTVETISRLREQYGDSTRLFFVMGADSFEEITSWREPARLLKETNLIVVTRPGYEIDISGFAERFGSEVIDLQAQGSARLLEAGCRTYVIDCASEDISSTGIRQRVREGRAIEGLVPELVEKYIRKYQLYGGS